MFGRLSRKGFVLVFALWVLSLLTVLAVSVASGVRQKIILVKKLDERSRMHYLLEGAAVRTKVYIRKQLAEAGSSYTAAFKMGLHNYPLFFAHMSLSGDMASTAYTFYDAGLAVERFGVVDEERKINVNTAGLAVLQRLIERVLGFREDDAKHLAQAMVDWRQPWSGEVSGFFSEEYYANLQYPFRKKDAPYEVPDELLLIKGMTGGVYELLRPYITVYGEGRVNINTAPAPVLYALGLEDPLIEKILSARRGQDAVEGTLDDHVFARVFDVAVEVDALFKLEPQELRAIDALNLQGALTVNPSFFSFDIQGQLAGKSWTRALRVVYSAAENKILYWREK